MIVNFFVSFLLLELTGRIMKKDISLRRIVFASVIGAVYSLIILLDSLPTWVLIISKLAVSLLMVFTAFKFYRLLQFVKGIFLFYLSSVVFLGVIIFICFVSKTKAIAVNNSVVYFNVSSLGLILSAGVAYIVSCIAIRIYNRSLGKKEIYTLIVTNEGKSVTLLAFLDTGNRLREPFTDSPVIIADKSKVSHLLGSCKTRIIPANTVSSSSLLVAFKPDKIVIKSSKTSEEIENVYIALSDNMASTQYSAILNPDILSI